MNVLSALSVVALTAVALTPSASAQLRCVAPSVGNSGTASTSTSYPWNRKTSNIRVQYCYDPSEIPGGGLLVISRLKFRPVDSAPTTTSWDGGRYGDVEIKMSNGAFAYDQITTDFANNHGTNATTVYKGSVDVMAGIGTGAGVPSNPYVDVEFQVPFIYDPTQGSLLIDIACDGSQFVPNNGSSNPTVLTACTFTTDVKKVYRMYNLTDHRATTGAIQASVGMVMEMVCASRGVVVVGSSCDDGLGVTSEHYADEEPTVGNSSFAFKARMLPSQASALFVVGIVPNYQSFDLSPIGAPGCFLHTDPFLQIGMRTAGMPNAADGTLVVPAAIPNNPQLTGTFLQTQVWVVDGNSTNPLGVVFTNGLGVTVL